MKERSRVNVATGLLYQLINTFLGLLLPYLFITGFGSETNGLLSSVTQLFVYLELLEAGVGTTAQQALYKPVTIDDRSSINSILAAIASYYKKTGIVYAILMSLLAFIFPLLVDSTLPPQTITFTILLQGVGSVCSYFFQAKYMVLLRAEGKVYLINGLMMLSSVMRNIGKIVAIYLGFGILTVQAVQMIVVIAQGAVIMIYINKKYSWINLEVKPNFEAISQKNSVLVQHLGWVIMNHSSTFLLTITTRNLAIVSVYSLYTTVFESVQNLVEAIKGSFQYKLGWKSQSSKAEFEKYFRNYEKYYYAITFSLFGIAYVLVQPFLRLYVGSVQDADYMLRGLPELFLLAKILSSLRGINKQVIESIGHFKNTQYIAIGEVIINLLFSSVFVFLWGIYGVLIGASAALLYSVILLLRYTNHVVFPHGIVKELKQVFMYTLILVVLCILVKSIKIQIDSYITLLIYAVSVGCVFMGFFFGITFIINKIQAKQEK